MKRTIAAMTVAAAGLVSTGFAADVTLAPRVEIPKTPTALLDVPEHFTGRAVVKFEDAVAARPTGLGNVASATGADLTAVDAILSQQRVRLVTAFPGVEPAQLALIEARAAARSGRAQPDLRGIMYLDGAPAAVEAAARQLNDLGFVEYVGFEQMRFPGDGSGNPYPHAGNWREMAELDARLHPEGSPLRAKPWAVGGGDMAYEPPIATAMREELKEMGVMPGELGTEAPAPAGRGDAWSAEEPGTPEFAFGGEDPDCGVDGTGNCFEVDGNGSPFCEDQACCDQICEVDEFCCDVEWDSLCAAQANFFCGTHTPNDPEAPTDPPAGPDRCAASIFQNSCFAPSFSAGCNDAACCFDVCEIDPFCCEAVWDFGCAELALETCTDEVDTGTTPDMSGIQGYLTAGEYENPLPDEFPFDRYGFPLPTGGLFPGFTGTGFDLYQEGESFDDFGEDGIPDTNDPGEGNNWWDPGEPFDDANGDGIWNEPRGIRGIAERAFFRDGIDRFGQGVQVRGRSMNVAIIDGSIYANHEEFAPLVVDGEELDGRKVIVEDIRLFFDESIASPSQGTAVASVILARDETVFDQDAAGVTGIVPEAQGYFYAITSRDEGPRELAAWSNAIAQMESGDVIVASYTLPNTSLNLDPLINTLALLATDSGIGVVMAAGDDCADLSGNTQGEDLPDSGAIVVGGGSPGVAFLPNIGRSIPYRLPFSNYTSSEEVLDATDARQVHLRAWGAFVAAAGFGDLFRIDPGDGTGIDPNRAYTGSFGGTAAAAAQVAGLYVATQGFNRQYYGFSLTPTLVRQLLDAPGATPGTPPRLFGSFDPICGLDIVPETPWNHIGGFPALTGGGGVVNQLLQIENVEFDDAPFVQDVVLVRGDYVEGSVFSVKGLDGNVYRATGVDTAADDVPVTEGVGGSGPNVLVDVPELGSAGYLIGGDIVDLVAIGQTSQRNPTELGIRVVSGASEVFTLVFVEAYNFKTTRWSFVGVAPNLEGSDETFLVPQPADHVSPTGRILARAYYVGFTINSGRQFVPTEYQSRTDLIDIRPVGGTQK